MSSSLPVGEPDRTANDNAALSLVPTLVALSKCTGALLGLRLAVIGLRTGQDEVLMQLGPRDSTSAATLAERLCIRPTTAATVLSHLVGKGFVVADKTLPDHFTATPEGIVTQQKVRQLYRQFEQDLILPGGMPGNLAEDLRFLRLRLSGLLSTVG